MKFQRIRAFFMGFGSFLLLWWILSFVMQNRALPAPLPTFYKIWQLKDVLLLHIGASMLRILSALSISLFVGVPLGIWLSRSQKANQILGPLLYFLYPLPKVAFLPIFMIFFGLGNLSKIILIFSVIGIQVMVSIRDSVNAIPETYYQVVENYHAGIGMKLRYVILPGLLPSLFASLRVSVAISLASLFFAENYNTTYGIGYLILSAWSKMDYEQMLAGILLIALLGFFLFSGLDELERKFCSYR